MDNTNNNQGKRHIFLDISIILTVLYQRTLLNHS
uniref:Uncharacterized protein n=1 Tax=Arundo donax TaxID=35708 RepID=A0A0A9C560_ARUDO